MRTTVTLDPDVARLVDEATHRQRRSRKQVINDALRDALAAEGTPRPEPYTLSPHHSAVRPGIDLTGFNRLADEFEDEALLDAMQRRA